MDWFLLVFLVTSIAVMCGGHEKEKEEECCSSIIVWETVKPYQQCQPAKCPEPLGREWHTLQAVCCSHDKYFHCQQDKDGSIDVFCLPPLQCPKGFFFYIKNVMRFRIGCQTCPLEEYQPTLKYTYNFVRPSCDKKRIKCEEFDAVPLVTGNSSSDDTCMCNWINGYRPVKPRHHCRAFNSSQASTCRCEHHPCPKGEILLPPSFECIRIADADEDYRIALYEYSQQLDHRLDGTSAILKAFRDELHLMHKLKDSMGGLNTLSMFTIVENAAPQEELPQKEPPQSQVQTSVYALELLFTDQPSLLVPVCPCCESYGQKVMVFVFVFGAAALCQIFFKGNGKTRDFLIRVSLNSQKTADILQKEVKNILPMLSRHYGELHLAVRSDSRCLSIILHPRAGKPLNLSHFLRDILSPEAVKRAIGSAGSSTREEMEICVWSGCFKDGRQAHVDHTPPANCSDVRCDTGQIIFRFSEANEELLKSLRTPSSKAALKKIFTRHQLDFQDIRSGSIIFRFQLLNGSRTFDEFAIDQRMNDLAKDLLSHEAFNSLAREVPVDVEFVCKAKLENVAAVYAENLTMQIGKQNNIYLCHADPASHCDHAQANVVDEDVFVSKADEHQTAVGEMVKANILRTKNVTPGRLGVKESWVTRNKEPNDVFIKVQCDSPEMSERLQRQWLNIMPLLKHHYPDCQMHHSYRDKSIVWRLRSPDGKIPDACSFLTDIIAIESVKYLVMEYRPRILTFLPDSSEVALSLRQRVFTLGKTWMLAASVRLSSAAIGVVQVIFSRFPFCNSRYSLLSAACVITFVYLFDRNQDIMKTKL